MCVTLGLFILNSLKQRVGRSGSPIATGFYWKSHCSNTCMCGHFSELSKKQKQTKFLPLLLFLFLLLLLLLLHFIYDNLSPCSDHGRVKTSECMLPLMITKRIRYKESYARTFVALRDRKECGDQTRFTTYQKHYIISFKTKNADELKKREGKE